MSPDRLQALVRNMANTLVHRGPDGKGEYVAPHIGLAMRRLAIIDREHGQQPMSSDNGSLVLSYNGEIYNYRALRAALAAEGCPFRTSSDTEVLLRVLERYGSAGIQRLEGMFTFALWNAPRAAVAAGARLAGAEISLLRRDHRTVCLRVGNQGASKVPGVVPRLDLGAFRIT